MDCLYRITAKFFLVILFSGYFFLTHLAYAENNTSALSLYILKASSGAIVENPVTGNCQLQISQNGPFVYYFSERPKHTVGSLPLAKFLHLWSTGPNNFSQNPPNAALAAVSKKKSSEQVNIIVILKHPKYDTKTDSLVFDMKKLRGNINATQLTDITLFIDADVNGINISPDPYYNM